MKHIGVYLVLTSAFFLTACGGGSGDSSTSGLTYTGLTTPVAIDANNAATLGSSTAEASQEAISQDIASDANPFVISITSENTSLYPVFVDIAKKIANNNQSLNLPIGPQTLTTTELGLGSEFCGGSVTVDDAFINDLNSNGYLNGSITMNNLCYNDSSVGQIILNGTLTFTQTSTSITMSFVNFSVSNNASISATINMTVTCDTSFLSCTISAVYIGDDGKTYQISNLIITSSGSTYTLTATFYHPDFGSVSIAGSNLTYGCSNGLPDGGTITYTGANNSSATITFRGDCSGYDGSYNDGTTSGSFSGNWQ